MNYLEIIEQALNRLQRVIDAFPEVFKNENV